MPRQPAPPPPPSQRRIEELGRRLHASGAPTWFVPSVGHQRATAPVLGYTLGLLIALALGFLKPLLGVALCLAVVGAAFMDLQGHQSWLRRLLPRDAGWTVAAELAPGAGPDAPTVVVWAPATPARPSPARRPGLVLAAFLLGLLVAFVGAIGLLLRISHPEVGDLVILASAAGAVTVGSAVLLAGRLGHRQPLGAEPSDLLAALAPRLRAHAPGDTRLLVAAGSLGAPWHDELVHLLADPRLGLRRSRTTLVCLESARHPLAAVSQDGIAVPRRPPAALLAATQEAGLPTVRGWTAATRASRLGLRAIGLAGVEHGAGEGPERVEAALRCIVRVLPALPSA